MSARRKTADRNPTHTHLVFGDSISKALRKIRKLSFLKYWSGSLPSWLRLWLRFIGQTFCCRRCRLFCTFTGEKVFEDFLGLPLGRVFEVYPNVHPARSAQGGVQSLDVIGSCEKQAGSGVCQYGRGRRDWSRGNSPPLCGSNTIQTI